MISPYIPLTLGIAASIALITLLAYAAVTTFRNRRTLRNHTKHSSAKPADTPGIE